MKPLTLVEVEQIVDVLSALVGAQLQEVIANDRGLAMGFYQEGMTYLVLDLSQQNPGLFLFEQIPFWRKSPQPKPVSLFLNSHGKNLFLRDVKVDNERGRVVTIYLEGLGRSCELELILIPKQSNLIIKAREAAGAKKRSSEKSISWAKPKEIPPAPMILDTTLPRGFAEIHQQWLDGLTQKTGPALDPIAQWEKTKKHQIEKKRKAMGEIEKAIADSQDQQWQELGERLKIQGLESLESHWTSWLDSRLSLKDNRERAFAKAKQIRQKRVGQQQRLEILRNEISQLENSTFEAAAKAGAKQAANVDLFRKSESSGRRKRLPSGVEVYVGKTAKDNLQILRAAKAWDYWLHLRDFPGAHAIIHRNKNQSVSDEELREVARWVAEESLARKALALGQRLNVAVVECRFVKPIKGDRHGRVHYHGERNIIIQW